MITYLNDTNEQLKIIKNKKEIIFDPIDKEEVTIKISSQTNEMYKLLLKYYETIINEYYNQFFYQEIKKIGNELKNYKMINNNANPTEINFYSDNSLPDFANILKIKKNIDYISFNTISKKDKILGNFILLTSEDNYGKYGQFYDTISQMIEDIDKINQKEKKLKIH